MEFVADITNDIKDEITEEDPDSEISKLRSQLEGIIQEKDAILTAYRNRWDESMSGTKVNGDYVDKVVERDDEYTYERLLGGL